MKVMNGYGACICQDGEVGWLAKPRNHTPLDSTLRRAKGREKRERGGQIVAPSAGGDLVMKGSAKRIKVPETWADV